MSKMSTGEKWGAAVVVTAFFWYVLVGIRAGETYSGTGSVDVFPDVNSSKSYRLEADMIVKHELNGPLSVREFYRVSVIHWPNGGYSEFDDCTVAKGASAMCTTGDKRYAVEVIVTPDNTNATYDGSGY